MRGKGTRGNAYQDEIRRRREFRQYLRRTLAYNRLLATATTPPRPPAGRPVGSALEGDRRTGEAWDGGHETYADLAAALGRTERDVRLAVDRHRKRIKARK